jgi:hypothetical protein
MEVDLVMSPSHDLSDDDICDTYLKQIHDGNIEVRTDTNLKELEENYTEEDMISMLELPNEAAKYDIYNVLIGTSIDK